MTTYIAIQQAIDVAMQRDDGLPQHIALSLPRRVTRATLDRCAEHASAWVREYHPDTRSAIIALR